jgi:G:T/U-mismatch repair DNA glycosylase
MQGEEDDARDAAPDSKRRRPPPPPPRSMPPPPPGGVPPLLPPRALRLIIVGHNPSMAAWAAGHRYAHGSNWMWRIVREVGLVPPGIRGAADDARTPELAGVGWTDVGGHVPGTRSAAFTSADFDAWRAPFFERLAAQARGAAAAAGCACGRCGAPTVVAFAGKRQFVELFPARGAAAAAAAAPAPGGAAWVQARRPARVEFGRQRALPAGWPLPLDATECWVVSSTSGAAPMTREARFGPWRELAARVAREPWPRAVALRCGDAAR